MKWTWLSLAPCVLIKGIFFFTQRKEGGGVRAKPSHPNSLSNLESDFYAFLFCFFLMKSDATQIMLRITMPFLNQPVG